MFSRQDPEKMLRYVQHRNKIAMPLVTALQLFKNFSKSALPIEISSI
jgi:hypothetical protein